jgi:hypothetical protein
MDKNLCATSEGTTAAPHWRHCCLLLPAASLSL